MAGPFPGTENEVRAAIRQVVIVNPQKVAIAKSIICRFVDKRSESHDLVGAILSAHGITAPAKVTFHKQYDSTADIRSLGELFSWRLAGAEAILSLVNGNHLVPISKEFYEFDFQFQYFMGYPGSGGHGGGITFDEYRMVVPHRVRLASSFEAGTSQILVDADLYLQTLMIPGMHGEIASAFKEAVRCFRHDFFGAAVAMLGKASEGAWIELGTSLMNAVPTDKRPSVEKQRKILDNPREGAAKKMDAVLQLFEKQDIFDQIARSSGVGLDLLRSVWEWSNIVRNSRNTIHFGVTSVVPVTYETISVLLLGAVSHVQALYKLRDAAESSRVPG
jgi:hypothetical protein